MRWVAVLCAAAVAACGDNIVPIGDPLASAAAVVIVPHADDATTRMQPDLASVITHKRGLTILALARGGDDAGARAAIAELAGDAAWACGVVPLNGHAVQHCRLASARVSIVAFDLPQLAPLWRGDLDVVDGFDRDLLASTLATAIVDSHPTSIRLLDPLADGDDGIASALALIATARANAAVAMFSFVSPAGAPRRAIGYRGNAHGKLTLDHVACMTANSDGSLALVPCATAPVWTIARDGRLSLDAQHCLQTLPTDELVVGDCGSREAANPSLAYRLDDAGHLWASTLPIIGGSGLEGDLACLVAAGGRVRARGCAAGAAPTWSLVPAIATSTGLGLAATGRALRLGDVDGDGAADLCEANATGLHCARSKGDGTFAAATRIDLPTRPFVIAPASLAFGDVDGDTRADACGHVQSGVLCALAAGGFAAAPWSDAFGEPGVDDASFTIIDADARPGLELCGRVGASIYCVTHDGPTQPPPLTTGTAAASAVWIADLEGDHRADWCGAVASGVACELADAGAAASTGKPYSSDTGLAANTAAFADLDGDGFADLCVAVGAEVHCARGQGFGFGPDLVVEGLTGNPILGDIDGDGLADVCTDTFACAR